MPKVKNIEKKIWDIEGFDVKLKHPNGNDIRGDKDGVTQYPFERAAKNDMTIKEWKANRFYSTYPGYEISVLNANGEEMVGQVKLATVRDTYLDDE